MHPHPASETPATDAIARWALIDRIAPGFVAGREPTYGALSGAWWRLTGAERALFESLDAFGVAIWKRVDPTGFERQHVTIVTGRTLAEYTQTITDRWPRIDLRDAALVRHDGSGAVPITVFVRRDGSRVLVCDS